jgi:hypothetical protein
MTWVLLVTDPQLGVAIVGADDFTDAYYGDTPCTEALPILCIDTAEWFDNPGVGTDRTHGWCGYWLAQTDPIVGSELTSIDAANLVCSEQLGESFRMAEFHDGGGGWHWWAYANLPELSFDTRFWTHINDQPANCWD